MTDRDYVLGTHDEELHRLGLQHQIWRAQAYSLWERADFKLGDRLLDVGCGPGFATADLSQLVGPSGHITGVDVSSKYVEHARSRNLANVEIQHDDVQAMKLPESSFDGAYARWLLCFVPQPQRVIEGVARSLKPGGRFAIHDYYNYRAMKLAPRSEIFERIVAAVDRSWRDHDGDPEIGCRLPAMLESAGLRVTHLQPIVRIGKPDGSLWQWPTTFFRIFVPSLVKMNLLTSADEEAFLRDWDDHARDPHAFFSTPPMLEIIARRDAGARETSV